MKRAEKIMYLINPTQEIIEINTKILIDQIQEREDLEIEIALEDYNENEVRNGLTDLGFENLNSAIYAINYNPVAANVPIPISLLGMLINIGDNAKSHVYLKSIDSKTMLLRFEFL